jgi:hypothetical protein
MKLKNAAHRTASLAKGRSGNYRCNRISCIVKAVDVIENESEENENDDEGEWRS